MKLSKTIDCMFQHIKIFYEQSAYNRTADFGEPCARCPHVTECNLDWLSEMSLLHDLSSVKISVVYQELPDTQDSDDTHHDQGKDTFHVADMNKHPSCSQGVKSL